MQMKKVYEAPEMEIEMFTADEPIAVSGPEYIPGGEIGDQFGDL